MEPHFFPGSLRAQASAKSFEVSWGEKAFYKKEELLLLPDFGELAMVWGIWKVDFTFNCLGLFLIRNENFS